MKSIFAMILMVFSPSVFASTVRCEITSINEKSTPSTYRMALDTTEVLLALSRGRGNEMLVDSENVYPFDIPTLWFDRSDECTYRQERLPNRSTHYKFSCEAPHMTYVLSIVIHRSGETGLIQSSFQTQGLPRELNTLTLSKCR